MKNVLYLYERTQTYTDTVFQHINAFSRYSSYRTFFSHQSAYTKFSVNLSRFDAVGIHYSIRLPYDQVSVSTAAALKSYTGLKFLFIQDEYDYTRRAWYWIKELGISLVFTVVPADKIHSVYPPHEFPGVTFVNVLTGYVPENIIASDIKPVSDRDVIVGYRGRPLSVRYGKLGREKVQVGKVVKAYCDQNDIKSDIGWRERSHLRDCLV